MRILDRQPREGRIRVRTESLDDLWELAHIIETGDHVSAKTERKIAIDGDRAKQVRKPMTLTVEVTDVAFEEGILRVQGTITEGPEDLISFGDYHSFSFGQGNELDIIKNWDAVSEQRLKQAEQTKPLNILLVTFDRESAYLAELTRQGYDVVHTLKGDVAKKQDGGGSEDFWRTLAAAIQELDGRKKYNTIVAASPAFWNEYLVNALNEELKAKTVTASCSAVGEAALAEVVKRPELAQALEKDRTSQEEILVNHVLEAIHQNKACYGTDDCAEKAQLGQIETLIVTLPTIAKARNDGSFEALDAILTQAQATKAEVHIIEHVTEQIDSLGGIAGALRW